MERTGWIMSLSQSFGIDGFCEQGIYFKVESWHISIVVIGIIIAVLTAFMHYKQEKGIIKKSSKVHAIKMPLVGSALGIVLLMSVGGLVAADLFTYFICFQILLLASYLLVVQKQTKAALRAGNGYLTYGLLTGMMMLMGMFLLSHEADTTGFEALQGFAMLEQEKTGIYLIGGLFLVGFGMNMGLCPLHTWQDRVYKETSAVMGGFFASLINKVGLVGLWMMTLTIFEGDNGWYQLLMALGLLTTLIACMRSFFSNHVKEAVGFGCAASMGVLVAGIGSEAFILYPLLLHMIGSFLVFAVLGYLEKQKLSFDLKEISGAKENPIGMKSPLLMLGFAVGTVLLSGLSFWVGKMGTQMKIGFMLLGLLIFMNLMRLFVLLFTPADARKQNLCKIKLREGVSLEACIYEPLIIRLIPFVAAVVLRVCDKLVDGTVILLRQTVYKDKKERVWDKVGTPLTYIGGIILDDFVICLNKTFFRKNPIRICFVNQLAEWKSGLSLASKLVVRSVSFGLLMFCIGLCLTLGYILLI